MVWSQIGSKDLQCIDGWPPVEEKNLPVLEIALEIKLGVPVASHRGPGDTVTGRSENLRRMQQEVLH